MKHKAMSATMERTPMAHTSMEPMVSFAEMLRTIDPELSKVVRIPALWFPKTHIRRDQAKLIPPGLAQPDEREELVELALLRPVGVAVDAELRHFCRVEPVVVAHFP